MTDHGAARVAEVRHVLERCVGTYQSIALSPQDAANWLAALATAEQRATRLAALEAAARTWAQHRAIARDPKTTPDAYWANTQALVKAERVLDTAVANLAAPPVEGA